MHSFRHTRDSATRSHRLRSGISLLTLALTLGATASARAATYTASNEAELNAAIAAANNDGDATSTITLTGDFTIAQNALAAVTKTLTIDVGAFQLTSAGTMTVDVAGGAQLTIDGSVRVTGTPGTSGSLLKAGEGTLVLSGGASGLNWTLHNGSGNTIIRDGANVMFNSSVGGGPSGLSAGAGSVTVSGIGTVLTDAGGSQLGNPSGSTLNVEAGGRFVGGTKTVLVLGDGTVAALNVTGDGSRFEGAIDTMRGTAVINVTGGGKIQSNTVGIGGVSSASNFISPGVSGLGGLITVSGEGSRWDSNNSFFMSKGTLDVLDGGVVESGFMSIAHLAGRAATVTVSGAGSQLVTNAARDVDVGLAGDGTLTVANRGAITVRDGEGTIKLGTNATGKGTLNIGGGTGQAATAAGTIDAALIQFGAGAGTLNFNHTDAAYGFDTQLVGNGTINHVGGGKTVLTEDQTAFTGKANVLAGILEVNGSLGGTMDVLGGRLQGTGTVGATRNAAGGVIAPGNSIGTLTVAGDYTSDGGRLEIEAELGDDSSPTDMLVITGASILGTGATRVFVTNLGGLGAETTGDGIKIVDVTGASDAGAFVLGGPAIGGAHRYDLFQNDLLGTLDDGDWYLRAAGLAPTIPVYENYPQVLLGMIALPTLEQRIGDRHRSAMGAGDAEATGIWTRIEAEHGHFESAASTFGASYDADTALVQVGFDAQLWQGASGVLVGGLTAQYLRASADISSNLGSGGNDTDSFGVGATLTWYGQGGFYVDAQAQIASLSSDLSIAGGGVFGDGIDGDGYALSLEAGREIALGDGWSLTPQAQLAWSSVDFDSFTDRFGADVSLRDGDSLKGRIGIAANYEAGPAGTKVYGIANLTYEFLDGTGVVVSGVDASFEPQRFGGELGVGGTYQWAGGKYALHGEVLGSSSFEGSYGVKGTAGLSMNF